LIINFLFVYLQKIIKMNLDNDKDFQKKLQKGYKRLALVSSIWALISSPFLFIVPDESKSFAVLIWYVWVILGVALSPKIVNRIWK